jgi:ribosomal protein S18 acetylase RimI-like enzyme
MRYRLIPAAAKDQAWLEQLRRSVYQDLFFATWGDWDEARHLRHCAECWARGEISLIEVNGSPIGMIQLFELTDSIEVGEIQISPQHQNEGIGTQLLRDTIDRAQTQSKKVVLATGLQNNRAFQLYLRLGFRHVRQTDTHNHMEYEPR